MLKFLNYNIISLELRTLPVSTTRFSGTREYRFLSQPSILSPSFATSILHFVFLRSCLYIYRPPFCNAKYPENFFFFFFLALLFCHAYAWGGIPAYMETNIHKYVHLFVYIYIYIDMYIQVYMRTYVYVIHI